MGGGVVELYYGVAGTTRGEYYLIVFVFLLYFCLLISYILSLFI